MAWMTAEAAVIQTITAGVLATSTALIGFGLDSVIEFDVEARKARDTIGWPWGDRCHAGRLQALCLISHRRRTRSAVGAAERAPSPDLGEPSLTAKPGNRFTIRTAKDGLVAGPRALEGDSACRT